LLIWHSNGTCSFIAGIFLSNMGISITSLELESATLYPPHLSCSGSMRKGLSELSGATKPGLGEQPGGCWESRKMSKMCGRPPFILFDLIFWFIWDIASVSIGTWFQSGYFMFDHPGQDLWYRWWFSSDVHFFASQSWKYIGIQYSSPCIDLFAWRQTRLF
jgi:hypothetical protein